MELLSDTFPCNQGVDCKTFKTPPLDGSLPLHELYDYNAIHSPKHPLYRFEAQDSSIKTLSWDDARPGIHRAASFATKFLEESTGSSGSPKVIGILANSDTITYQCFLIGLMRAGYQPFPISIRNSKYGVANMLLQTSAVHLFTSGDESMQTVAADSLAELRKEGREISLFKMPGFHDLFPTNDNGEFEVFPAVRIASLDSPALILHSSGSTAFPKLRTLTHRILLQRARTPHYGERDLCGEVLSVHALPLFHASGLFHTCWAPSTGMILSTFYPGTPPVVLTPDRQLASCKSTSVTLLFAVPSFMETWSAEPESVEQLKLLKGLIFGGAPLSKSVGDFLESKGIPLWHLYGATEMGIVTSCMPRKTIPSGWEYISFSPHVKAVMLPQEEDGLIELALTPSAIHTPSITNSYFDGQAVYATGDLFLKHPSEEGLYKIHGRADDQIMLSTGEKTNPAPLEHIISRSPLINNALMFGRGKFQNGVIIEPVQPFDPADAKQLSNFRNAIWPDVEKANAFAPTHSRIFKEMIIVCKPDRPFEYTPKRNPRRHVSVALYSEEIEATYRAVEQSSLVEILPPTAWTLELTLEFVRSIVSQVMKKEVSDDVDIFEWGCDSLQATWIRNTILHALRITSASLGHVDSTFVFMHPTVSSLSEAIARGVKTSENRC